MLRIGLTGGIGSGKSLACLFFSELNVPVLDADQVGRAMLEPGEPGFVWLKSRFGSAAVGPDGKINRKMVRARVFEDKNLRYQLEQFLHPRIKAVLKDEMEALHDIPYAVISVPLLLETDFLELVDRVLVIDTDIELQIERAMKRDGQSRHAIEKIIAAQIDRDKRLQLADDVIENNTSPENLYKEVLRLHRFYSGLS